MESSSFSSSPPSSTTILRRRSSSRTSSNNNNNNNTYNNTNTNNNTTATNNNTNNNKPQKNNKKNTDKNMSKHKWRKSNNNNNNKSEVEEEEEKQEKTRRSSKRINGSSGDSVVGEHSGMVEKGKGRTLRNNNNNNVVDDNIVERKRSSSRTKSNDSAPVPVTRTRSSSEGAKSKKRSLSSPRIKTPPPPVKIRKKPGPKPKPKIDRSVSDTLVVAASILPRRKSKRQIKPKHWASLQSFNDNDDDDENDDENMEDSDSVSIASSQQEIRKRRLSEVSSVVGSSSAVKRKKRAYKRRNLNNNNNKTGASGKKRKYKKRAKKKPIDEDNDDVGYSSVDELDLLAEFGSLEGELNSLDMEKPKKSNDSNDDDDKSTTTVIKVDSLLELEAIISLTLLDGGDKYSKTTEVRKKRAYNRKVPLKRGVSSPAGSLSSKATSATNNNKDNNNNNNNNKTEEDDSLNPKRKKYDSILYRFSRRELAIALFSHLSAGRGNTHDPKVFFEIIQTIVTTEGWELKPVGEENQIDISQLGKELLIRLCDELGVKLTYGRRPNFGLGPTKRKSYRPFSREIEGAEGPFCVCASDYVDYSMVECTGGSSGRCHGWFHPACIGQEMDEETSTKTKKTYTCPMCEFQAKGMYLDIIGDVDRRKRKVCCFCSGTEETHQVGSFTGPFLIPGNAKDRFWAHRLCAFASKGTGLSKEGFWFNVGRAIDSSLTQKCRHCKELGATIAITNSKKEEFLHLPCVFEAFATKKFIGQNLKKLQKITNSFKTMMKKKKPKYNDNDDDDEDDEDLEQEEKKFDEQAKIIQNVLKNIGSTA